VIARRWANLALINDQLGCISTGEVNQQALFPRVAAAVHHSGAGTTAASRAGVPQVVIPQMSDQPCFADRVQQLGRGTAFTDSPTSDNLRGALEHALGVECITSAHTVSATGKTDGALIAAQRLLELA